MRSRRSRRKRAGETGRRSRDDPHDEAADDEEDVDAGRADREVPAGPLGGMEDDHGQRRNGAQILDAVELFHHASRSCGADAGSCVASRAAATRRGAAQQSGRVVEQEGADVVGIDHVDLDEGAHQQHRRDAEGE